MKKKQASRIKISFTMDQREENELQMSIFDKTREITHLLKESEQELKRLQNAESENKSDEQIKTNILSVLAMSLKERTQIFKHNEKEFYIKLKEFHGDEVTTSKSGHIDDQYFQSELQMQDSGAKYKDEEISHLVKSINDLASIFKDLSVLVVE